MLFPKKFALKYFAYLFKNKYLEYLKINLHISYSLFCSFMVAASVQIFKNLKFMDKLKRYSFP